MNHKHYSACLSESYNYNKSSTGMWERLYPSVFVKTFSFPGKRNVKDMPVRPEANERGGVRTALILQQTQLPH